MANKLLLDVWKCIFTSDIFINKQHDILGIYTIVITICLFSRFNTFAKPRDRKLHAEPSWFAR